MEATAVVAVARIFEHPKYKKTLKRTRRFKADNRRGAKRGDKVVIEESRPISKEKRWRIVEVLTEK
jgi:small subunit ribosomal protein S17